MCGIATEAVAATLKPELPYDARLAAAAKRAKEMGYHVETRHGDQFYCRTVAPLGSRLIEKECLTVDTMAQARQMTEENQMARRQGQACQGGELLGQLMMERYVMQIRMWTVGVVAIALSACAASPQKRPPATVAIAPTADAPYDARIAEAAKRAKEMGYHVETRHGVQFYCRTVAPIGSRLTEKECLTVDTMIQTARMAEENRSAQQQSQLCQGAGCVIK